MTTNLSANDIHQDPSDPGIAISRDVSASVSVSAPKSFISAPAESGIAGTRPASAETGHFVFH